MASESYGLSKFCEGNDVPRDVPNGAETRLLQVALSDVTNLLASFHGPIDGLFVTFGYEAINGPTRNILFHNGKSNFDRSSSNQFTLPAENFRQPVFMMLATWNSNKLTRYAVQKSTFPQKEGACRWIMMIIIMKKKLIMFYWLLK